MKIKHVAFLAALLSGAAALPVCASNTADQEKQLDENPVISPLLKSVSPQEHQLGNHDDQSLLDEQPQQNLNQGPIDLDLEQKIGNLTLQTQPPLNVQNLIQETPEELQKTLEIFQNERNKIIYDISKAEKEIEEQDNFLKELLFRKGFDQEIESIKNKFFDQIEKQKDILSILKYDLQQSFKQIQKGQRADDGPLEYQDIVNLIKNDFLQYQTDLDQQLTISKDNIFSIQNGKQLEQSFADFREKQKVERDLTKNQDQLSLLQAAEAQIASQIHDVSAKIQTLNDTIAQEKKEMNDHEEVKVEEGPAQDLSDQAQAPSNTQEGEETQVASQETDQEQTHHNFSQVD